VLAEDLGGLDERHVRGDGAVGPDFHDELVVVGALADAGVFDVVADALDGAVDGVDGDHADFLLFLGLVLLGGGDVAAALGDGEFHLEGDLVGEGADDEILVVDLDRRRRPR
jgi:hypothetical protein